MKVTYESLLERSFLNREKFSDAVLSGLTYVAARQRGESETNRTDKIIISQPQLCGHINRICVACAYSWGWDYILVWDRTQGGRRLRKAIMDAGDQSVDLISLGEAKRPTGNITVRHGLACPPTGYNGESVPDERVE